MVELMFLCVGPISERKVRSSVCDRKDSLAIKTDKAEDFSKGGTKMPVIEGIRTQEIDDGQIFTAYAIDCEEDFATGGICLGKVSYTGSLYAGKFFSTDGSYPGKVISAASSSRVLKDMYGTGPAVSLEKHTSFRIPQSPRKSTSIVRKSEGFSYSPILGYGANFSFYQILEKSTHISQIFVNKLVKEEVVCYRHIGLVLIPEYYFKFNATIKMKYSDIHKVITTLPPNYKVRELVKHVEDNREKLKQYLDSGSICSADSGCGTASDCSDDNLSEDYLEQLKQCLNSGSICTTDSGCGTASDCSDDNLSEVNYFEQHKQYLDSGSICSTDSGYGTASYCSDDNLSEISESSFNDQEYGITTDKNMKMPLLHQKMFDLVNEKVSQFLSAIWSSTWSVRSIEVKLLNLTEGVESAASLQSIVRSICRYVQPLYRRLYELYSQERVNNLKENKSGHARPECSSSSSTEEGESFFRTIIAAGKKLYFYLY